MRVVSFEHSGRNSWGILRGDAIVDCGKRLGIGSLTHALEQGLLETAARIEGKGDVGFDEVHLLPAVPNPRKIICVGVNYAPHLAETGREKPDYPMLFPRFAVSQIGHDHPIILPTESTKLDFEGELAVVIGTAGRRITREAALSHVAGFACYNDVTLRDWQRHTTQFMPGKNFDGTGAFGPWLVTPDDLPDLASAKLETRLNGQVMQSAVIADLIFDIPSLIEYISSFTTLEPGDVIVTGTPGGVGAFREPPIWMKHGDVVEVEIDGIGVLRNPIR